jgi:hypothetical protein
MAAARFPVVPGTAQHPRSGLFISGKDSVMRSLAILVLQLVLSLLVVGAVMPAVLFSVAGARSPRAGVAVTGTIMLAVFLMLRLAWPRRRRS